MPRGRLERSISTASVTLSARPITIRVPVSPNRPPSAGATSQALATSTADERWAAAPFGDDDGVRRTGVIELLTDGWNVSGASVAGRRFGGFAAEAGELAAALDADFITARTDENAAAIRARAGALGVGVTAA